MVRLEGSIKRWVGLSSDAKPGLGARLEDGVTVTDADLPAGSSFTETDTGRVFRWSGSAWLTPPLDDALVQQLRLNGDELLKIRRVLETANDLTADDLV